jgi:hypothetical protein
MKTICILCLVQANEREIEVINLSTLDNAKQYLSILDSTPGKWYNYPTLKISDPHNMSMAGNNAIAGFYPEDIVDPTYADGPTLWSEYCRSTPIAPIYIIRERKVLEDDDIQRLRQTHSLSCSPTQLDIFSPEYRRRSTDNPGTDGYNVFDTTDIEYIC